MPSETRTPPAQPGATAPPANQPDFGEKARELFARCLDRARASSIAKLRHRYDWENLRFYRGGENQWGIWDPQSQRYVPRGTDSAQGGIPAYVPRCATNKFAVKIDGVAALLDQVQPAKEVGPVTPDDTDRAAAEVAEAALPAIFDELGYERDRAEIHKFITLTSMVGYALYYDNDETHGVEALQAQQCTSEACRAYAMPDELDEDGACPECGSPMAPAIDPRNGQPIGVEYPVGKLCAKVVSSFEIGLPPHARTTDTRRLPYVFTRSRLSTEEVVQRWPKLKDQQFDATVRGRGDVAGDAYADALSGLVAPSGSDSDAGASAGGLLVTELWHNPIDDKEFQFPRGLYRVEVEGVEAVSGPLDYEDADGKPFKNILIRQFAAAPGTAYGKPPGDDLVPLQRQRNIVESLIDLSLMHYAAPKEYIPTTVQLIDESTGAPGERVRYRSTDGQKPTIENGRSPAAGLYERLKLIDEAMDEVSRLNAVLAGERPEGDPTLGEVQMLREQGQAAFRAPLDGLVSFEKDVAEMALCIASQTMWTERFYKLKGDNGAWEVKSFLGSDLHGKYDVVIDRASAWPKSPMLHSLRLKEGLESGALPPPAADPEVAARMLSDLDLSSYKPSLDVDRKQIARELDAWKSATTDREILPPDPLTQNLQLHFALKQAFMKTETADELKRANPPVYAAMRSHLMQLQTLLMPAAPVDPNAPPDGQALGALVEGGALAPKPTERGAPIGDLVGKGVLRPAPPAPQEAARASR